MRTCESLSELPIVSKMREGLLRAIQARHAPVALYLTSESPSEDLLEQLSELRLEIEAYVAQVLEMKRSLPAKLKKQIRDSVFDEIFGFGPLGPLLRRPDVGNVYLEGARRVYFERWPSRGQMRLVKTRLPFRDDDHLMNVIRRIIVPLGLVMDERRPSVSGRLPNGSAVYASMAPASVHGPTLSLICTERTNLQIISGWVLHCDKGDHLPTVSSSSEGDSAVLTVEVPAEDMHTNLVQSFPARSFVGKKVRFSGALEFSSACEAHANLRAWGGKRNLQHMFPSQAEDLDSEDGSTWRRFASTLVIPEAAGRVVLSVVFGKPGVYRVRDLRFDIITDDGESQPRHHRVRYPVNLGLSLGGQ